MSVSSFPKREQPPTPPSTNLIHVPALAIPELRSSQKTPSSSQKFTAYEETFQEFGGDEFGSNFKRNMITVFALALMTLITLGIITLLYNLFEWDKLTPNGSTILLLATFISPVLVILAGWSIARKQKTLKVDWRTNKMKFTGHQVKPIKALTWANLIVEHNGKCVISLGVNPGESVHIVLKKPEHMMSDISFKNLIKLVEMSSLPDLHLPEDLQRYFEGGAVDKMLVYTRTEEELQVVAQNIQVTQSLHGVWKSEFVLALKELEQTHSAITHSD